MPLTLDGSAGISGVDGSNTAPAIRGTTQFAGISYAANTITLSTSARTAATINSDRSLLINTTVAPTTGGFANARISIKQTQDSVYGSGIQIESLPRDAVGYLGMSGNNFVIGQSYRGTGATGGGYGTMGFWTGGTELLTLTNQARVGIGNTTPSGKFTVQAAGADGIILDSDPISPINSGRIFFNAKPSGTNFAITSTANVLGIFSGSEPGNSTGTQRWSVDGSGRVQAPYQPVFSVHGYPSNISSGTITDWVSTAVNIGSCFNLTTGLFTAPVLGTYFFSVNIFADTVASSSSYWYLQLIKNNSVASGLVHSGIGFARSYESMTISGCIYLAAGDTAGVRITGSNADTYGGGYGNFAGFLVG